MIGEICFARSAYREYFESGDLPLDPTPPFVTTSGRVTINLLKKQAIPPDVYASIIEDVESSRDIQVPPGSYFARNRIGWPKSQNVLHLGPIPLVL